jgi:hypothetical protein
VRTSRRHPWRCAVLAWCGLCSGTSFSEVPQDIARGHPIAKVSTTGDLILLELNDGVLGQSKLFDLSGRTLPQKGRACPMLIIHKDNSTPGSSFWWSTGDARLPNSSTEQTAFADNGSNTGKQQQDIARP